MDKIIDVLSQKVIDKEWNDYELRHKEYKGITLGSYQYKDIINDFQSTGYIKMLMRNYFIKDYEIVERHSNGVAGISIYIEKEQFGKLEYFLKNIKSQKIDSNVGGITFFN